MIQSVSPNVVLPHDNTPVHIAAEMYAELGFRVVPLHGISGDRCTCGLPTCEPRSAGKHPIQAKWQKQASSDLDVVREMFRGHRWNIGLVLGDQLCVVDVDGDEGFISLDSLGELPLTLRSQSGSGIGEHRIFRYAEHQDPNQVTNRRIAPGLDIKTRNGQIVVAPSLHRSGRRYEWLTRVEPALLPDHLFDRIRVQRAVAPVVPLHPPTRTGDVYRRAKAYVDRIQPAISGSGGHNQTFTTARSIVGWIAKGLSAGDGWALFCDYNTRCSPPWSERELKHKWDDAMQRAEIVPSYEDRQPDYLRSDPSDHDAGFDPSDSARLDDFSHYDDVVANDAPNDGVANDTPVHRPAKPRREPTWQERLIWETSRNGTPKVAKHAENGIVITRYHEDWIGKIRLDTFACAVTVTNPPWCDTHKPASVARDAPIIWTDADTVRLSAWIRRQVGVDLSIEMCDRAVMVAAEAIPYHPVRDYLEGLKWDGQLRLANFAQTYLSAEDAPLARFAIRWWMTAAVARVYEPGCKADNVLILEGSQGLRKSSALRALAGKNWFTDTPIDLHNKDAYQAIQGQWVVELAELESMRGAESTRAKAFFSSPADTFRPPYGRRTITVPRGCVFAGTCNDATYLRDTTGNRRYWPILCHRIDVDAIARDRDQLWAEAREIYLGGAKWWPVTDEEIAAAESSQADRSEVDEWETIIASYLDRHPSDPSIGEILGQALGLNPSDFGRPEQMRVSVTLQRLGYKRYQTRQGKTRTWRYRKAPVVTTPGTVGLEPTVKEL